jgi:hypothetical protein
MLEEVVGPEVVPVVSAACERHDNDACLPRWCIVAFMAGGGRGIVLFWSSVILYFYLVKIINF